MKNLINPALAVALVIATPALAQSQTEAGTTAQESNGSSSAKHNSALLTIRKLKQDLQNAGFTDVQVLADSFVVQAKDKDGNPTVMTLSPGGVFAISALNGGGGQQREANARHGSSGPGTTSGPAEGTNVVPSHGPGTSGEPGTPGFPGNKNGPAVTPNK